MSKTNVPKKTRGIHRDIVASVCISAHAVLCLSPHVRYSLSETVAHVSYLSTSNLDQNSAILTFTVRPWVLAWSYLTF